MSGPTAILGGLDEVHALPSSITSLSLEKVVVTTASSASSGMQDQIQTTTSSTPASSLPSLFQEISTTTTTSTETSSLDVLMPSTTGVVAIETFVQPQVKPGPTSATATTIAFQTAAPLPSSTLVAASTASESSGASIVGPVVGGVVGFLLLLVLGGIWFCSKKNKSKALPGWTINEERKDDELLDQGFIVSKRPPRFSQLDRSQSSNSSWNPLDRDDDAYPKSSTQSHGSPYWFEKSSRDKSLRDLAASVTVGVKHEWWVPAYDSLRIWESLVHASCTLNHNLKHHASSLLGTVESQETFAKAIAIGFGDGVGAFSGHGVQHKLVSASYQEQRSLGSGRSGSVGMSDRGATASRSSSDISFRSDSEI
ncbi:hypothetical protein BDR26DRAFT_871968 [Obelidium mucronatum]|nr:hypothetical protein BDR26DRAFT_871968 [Obelidium mucronatum]